MSFRIVPYLSFIDQVCQQKFGRTYDFVAVETSFREHAIGKRHLTAKDVAKLFNPELTPYGNYWPKPHTKSLEEILTRKRLYVGPVKGTGREIVESLLAVFHNVGTVSLILRFVHPAHFGIFSTPVIYLLQVTRPSTIDLYLAYCDELGRWCKHFGLASVAQTEAALWVFAETIKNGTGQEDVEVALREFEEDLWVQRERAAQVIGPFFKRYGRLQLAKILLDEDSIIAGKIAAEEYERLLNLASLQFRGRPLAKIKGAPEGFIEELALRGYLRQEDKTELHRIWRTRNAVVHPSAKRPEREEVEVMIDFIERICLPWEKRGLRPLN